MRLSQLQPRSVADLPLSARQVDYFGPEIVEVISRGRTAPHPQPPPRVRNGNGRPDPTVIARFDRLRAWRAERAAQRGVEADVVLTNDALMAIARAAPADLDALASLGVLGPWKLEEYGVELMQVVSAS
jgi:ribonuclease D